MPPRRAEGYQKTARWPPGVGWRDSWPAKLTYWLQPFATAAANLPISSLTIGAASISVKWPAFGTTFAYDFGTLAAMASIQGVVTPGCNGTRLSSLLM